jgi:hypothetical protein
MNPSNPFEPRFLAPFRRRLSVLWVDERVRQWGPELLRLRRLRELYLQGDPGIYYRTDFTLPAEIGALHTLRKLELLNLPIDFPEWIMHLTNLRYLMVRGTNATAVPDWIVHLKRLHTLRVENCDLQSLPHTLRQMDNLRHLGLVHTQLLPNISPDQLPRNLKSLDILDSGQYEPADLAQLRKASKGTSINPAGAPASWRARPPRPTGPTISPQPAAPPAASGAAPPGC